MSADWDFGRHSFQRSGTRQGSHWRRRALCLEPLEHRALLHADPSILGDVSHDDHDDAPLSALDAPDAVPAAVTAQALLPDMTPWVSQSHGFLYDWTVQGNELRLTAAAANIGAGRMELRGGASHGDVQDVYQRVYEPNGSFTDVLAGTFTFHPEHGHIHFDGFAEYRLREVLPDGGVGPIVAAGDKISFCLLDVERYNTSGPSTPYFLECDQVQGISAGWADVYDRGLPGQEIDITGVPDGDYFLEAVVDPDNHLMESNEDNNVARIQIELARGGSGGPISPDTFEPNDSFSGASILAPPEDHEYEDLSIHAANNSDYYRVTASHDGTLTFSLSFIHANGDIDMQVFDANQQLLGLSDSVSNSEQFSVNATAGDFYYVHVYGYDGMTNPNYTFFVDQPEHEHEGGIADGFEDNDSFAGAHALPAVDETYLMLTIDEANDDDYYSFVPTASGSMSVAVAFAHAQGDIDLQILDASQSQLALSDSVTDNEQATVQVTAGQTYYVRVYGFDGAVNPEYSMTIDVPEGGGSTGDQFEENDSFAAAASLAAADQTHADLSIDAAGDDDYYSIVPLASGSMSVSVAFAHAQGDLDLQILNASQNQLALADSVTNDETANVAVTAGQTYYIHVYGFEGATNDYAMTIDVPEGGGSTGDQFEENDSFAAAASLAAADQTHADLSIDAAGDDDYYSIVPLASGSMSVSVAFAHAQGDLDLQILNASQNQLALADSVTNDETANVTVTAGQTYYIHVYGFEGATNDYAMTVDVPDALAPDVFEENDSFGAAASLAAADQTYVGLSINAAGDDDYYSIVPAASGTLAVSLAFQNAQGNVDLQVFDGAQAQLGQSTSTGNSEQVSVAVTAGQTYYVRVFGAGGAVNPSYSMTVDVPEPLPPDAFEDNDSFAAASALGAVDQTYTGLSIDAAGDDDYYSLVPTVSGTLAVSLAFQNAQGNVDLQLFDGAQAQLGQSTSTGNSEQVSVAVIAGQTYYARVFGAGGAVNPSYSMTVTVPQPAAGDQFEENDSFGAAHALTATDETYTGLSIDAPNDDDYYALVPTASGSMSVSVAFTHAQGDLDLQIFNASQSEIALSDSVSNDEAATVQVTAGQTYYIRVYGFEGATNDYAMALDVPDSGGGGEDSIYYLSTTDGGTLTGTAFDDSDILQLTVQANDEYQYDLYFDGSDVGLTTGSEDIDAFTLLPDGSILVSTTGSFSVPAAGGGTLNGNARDLLRFVPTSLGATTAGEWSLYFDGSDVGLRASGENIDSVALLSDGRLLISITGNLSVNGASGRDEDLAAFTPTSLGANTAGSWSLYFDGSDVGMSASSEDVDALYVRENGGNPTLFFSTVGNLSVSGASGADEDAVAFSPTSLGSNTAGSFGPGLAFDGSLYGLASFDVDGIFLETISANPTAVPSATASNAVASAVSLAVSEIVGDAEQLAGNGLPTETIADSLSAPDSRASDLAIASLAPSPPGADGSDSNDSESPADIIAEMVDGLFDRRRA